MLANTQIYTVSSLNQAAHALLDNQLGWVKVEGEISNLKKASSGHYYFSLKDSHCQVNCVMFSSCVDTETAALLAHGKQVVAVAKVGLYQPRGDYQLNVRQIEDAGFGLLQQQFEKLKAKLAAEGLFDAQFKQPLPVAPRVIGVVTSPQGAAIRDILITLKRRFIAAEIIIYPTEVQGKAAAPKIAQMIQRANTRAECDVLIVARGGGSLEDLWPFNEEIVAWAIFNSAIPIVTGIGHQIDTSIADYVADKTMPTPTAAAEAVSLNQQDWLIQLRQLSQRMQRVMHYRLQKNTQTLLFLQQTLQRFPRKIQDYWQTLDRSENRMKQCLQQQLLQKKNRLHHCITALRIMSPLATLERGYALAIAKNRTLIREPDQVHRGDTITVQLTKMTLSCQVLEKRVECNHEST